MYIRSTSVSRRFLRHGDAVSLNPQPLPPVAVWASINPQPLPPRYLQAGIIIVGG